MKEIETSETAEELDNPANIPEEESFEETLEENLENIHEEPTAAAGSAPDEEEVARLVAEAEQRGYLRGRNEKIAMEMRSPSLWETIRDDDQPDDDAEPPAILRYLRPSVWD